MKTLKTFRNILGISLVASSILLANENAAIQEKPKTQIWKIAEKVWIRIWKRMEILWIKI